MNSRTLTAAGVLSQASLTIFVLGLVVWPAPVNAQFCAAPINVPSNPPLKPHKCETGVTDKKDPCEECRNSPCYAGMGTYVTEATDLGIPTAGRPITVSRSYSSGLPVDGPLGLGWRSSLVSRALFATFAASATTTQNIILITAPSGATLEYREKADGSYARESGGADTLVRNADGSIDLTPANSQETLHFDDRGRLASFQAESGTQVIYTYDTGGRLERVADGGTSGRGVDVYWGADGRISVIRDHAGREVHYGYGQDGTLQTVTDPAGRTTHYGYSPGRFVPSLSQVSDQWNRVLTDIVYDDVGRVKSYTEAGEKHTYEYGYSNARNRTAKRDSAGNLWLYTFTEGGLITDRESPGGTQHSDFNPNGSVSRRVDEGGAATEFAYNASGSVSSVTNLAGTTSAIRWDYTYDPAFPEKVASVTPRRPSDSALLTTWQAWQYEYWPAGSPKPGSLKSSKRIRTDGTAEVLGTSEYDTQGRVTRQTSPSGAQTDYGYDSQGNLQTVTGPANNDSGTRPQTTYGYDALGRVSSVTDPLGRMTSYTYDGLGRVLTVTVPKPSPGSPLTFTTTYSYDNWDAGSGLVFTHVTDPNGRITKLGYDQFGRLLKSIDAANAATTYEYTKDVLTGIADANGNVTHYAYDALRRLRTTTFPDGATESYTYRADGLLDTKTDRKGTWVKYDYDDYKRLARKYDSTVGSVTNTYVGQLLTRVVDETVTPSETHTFTYDSSYRLESATQGPRGTITYGYGPDDRIWSVDLPGGVSSDYNYYADGSLKTIEWSPAVGSFRWDYTATGQYHQLTMPNGQMRTYSYDDQGRLLQLGNALGATNLASFTYGYDVDHATGTSTMLGQRTGLTASVPALGLSSALTKYYYDPLYQLKQAAYPSGAPFNGVPEAWTYDAIGNRVTAAIGASTRAYSYFKNAANPQNGQRLQSDGDASWTYDAAGNATTRQGSDGSFTLGYDSANRMNSISGAAAASYTYDYQGRRGSKTVGGVTTTYLYDGLNLVSETTGGLTTYFLNGPGIDEPLAMAKNGAVSYFNVDGLGSVVATNDPSGTVTHSVVFDAWGNVKAETGTRTHPFTYTGREVGEAGFHFYRARFYQPSVGRFSQEDPIGFEGGISLYGYVGGDPLWNTDPSGMEACPVPAPVAPAGAPPLHLVPPPDPELIVPPRWSPLWRFGLYGAVIYYSFRSQPAGGAGDELEPDDLPRPSPAPDPNCRPCGEGSGKWRCRASCNIENFSNVPNSPARVDAWGRGPSETVACQTAKDAAQLLSPRGTYTRHCQCRCKKIR